MNYPLISEYIEAIKSAEDNFDELSYLRPVLDEEGNPVMSVGGFSVVFKMQDERDGKLYAVKCFTKEQEGRTESYKLIADELEYVSTNYLTSIRFLENELFVDTSQTDETEYPVLLMDWVEGQTLDKYIKDNSEEKYILEMLAFQFCKLASWLLSQPFAHGDLKPDNILVKEDGKLVLVDYDGMYVPSMKGQKAKEIGSPGFRHPKRSEINFDDSIDDFSIVLIAMSLKAFSLNRNLIEEYCLSDLFFFNEDDLSHLNESNALSVLLDLFPDEDFCSLYGAFMIALANNSLSFVSPRLLTINNPKKSISYGAYLYKKGRKYCEAENNKVIDYKKAFKLFQKAAQLGYADAQCCVGCCYKNGYGTQVDYTKAWVWYEESSKKGCARALRHIAMCYEGGLGVDNNIHEAIRWYKKAIEKDDIVSLTIMGKIYYYGLGGIPPEYKTAFHWYQKAAIAGDSDAMWRLGNCYLNGKGVEKDEYRAFDWFEKSANQNNCEGLWRLGGLYVKGIGTKQDLGKAKAIYEKAAKLGYKKAIDKISSFKDDTLPFPVNSQMEEKPIPYPEPKESVIRKIKAQFLRVEKHQFYTYVAIINTLISEDCEGEKIRSIWIPSQLRGNLSVKIDVVGSNVKCAYSHRGIVSSFVSSCDANNIDDVVELSYNLLYRLELIGSFISNGALAIDEINELCLLKYHFDIDDLY